MGISAKQVCWSSSPKSIMAGRTSKINSDVTNLDIGTLNVGGIMSNIPYVEQCLNKVDIFVIQEHWLYPDSLSIFHSIHPDFTGWGRSSNDLKTDSLWRRGKGGVGMFWRKTMDAHIEKMDNMGNDRTLVIRVRTANKRNLYIIGVYLPSSNLSIHVYKAYIEELEEVFCQLQNLGTVIVLGDFNSHIGTLGGPRSFVSVNERGKILGHLIKRFDLKSVNSQLLCTGPVETFYSNNGLVKTTIDHMFVCEQHLNLLESCYVADDNCHNLSYHHPIYCCLETRTIRMAIKPKCKPQISWKNIHNPEIRDKYQSRVATGLDKLDIEAILPLNLSSTDIILEEITSILKSSADQTIPKRKPKHHLKPFWKKGMKVFHQSCRYYRKLWVLQGRPRDPLNKYFRNYKEAKCTFRRELRRRAYVEEEQNYQFLEKCFDIDKSVFQRSLLNTRKETAKQSNSLKIEGKLIDGPDELREAWKKHYSELYTPKYNPKFDDDFAAEIEECIRIYDDESHNTAHDTLEKSFTIDEVGVTCANLPDKKSSGPDELTYEHVKFGGHALLKILTIVLNAIRITEIIPKSFTVGNIISLFKSNKKDRYDKDNYRGITLLNVVGKIFERIILNRWMPFFNDIGFPNRLQFAYQRGKSSIDASMSLLEAVYYNCERGSKVYSCFLDSTKAFDTVWIPGLFYKIYNLGIQGKSWRILRNWYSAMTSRVLLDNKVSDEFCISQGVRQGGVLSPWLFMIFNNDMPDAINKCNLGLLLNEIPMNPIMVADDITLLSKSVKGLTLMLNELELYSSKWRFEFNPSKTVEVTFGETTQVHNKRKQLRKWKLYNSAIKEKECWTHVGIELSGNFSSSKRTYECCRKAKSAILSLAGLGLRPNALNPICALSLWHSIGIPTALYGCELWNNLTTSELEMLERTQCYIAKFIQGLHPNTRSEAAIGNLGLWSMEGIIDKNKLLYLGRLCRSDATLLSKEIFITCLFLHLSNPSKQKFGFVPDITRILEKYGLFDFLKRYIDGQPFPKKSQWKNIVYDKLNQIETSKWKSGMLRKQELNIYQRIHTNLKPLSIWEAAKRTPSCNKPSITCLVNIVSGNVPDTFKSWLKETNDGHHCSFCNRHIKNPNIHFIMSCFKFREWRNDMWDEIVDKLPSTYTVNLHKLDEEDQYEHIISGNIPESRVNQYYSDQLILIVSHFIYKLLTQFSLNE